jgi:hypothetical protein
MRVLLGVVSPWRGGRYGLWACVSLPRAHTLLMGSTTFTTYQRGSHEWAAFTDAVAGARHEYGHGGYSGTIAEVSNFEVVATPAPMWYDEAEKLAQQLLHEEEGRFSDAGGSCGALAVCSEHRLERVVVVGSDSSDWDALVASATSLGRGESIKSSKVVESYGALGSLTRSYDVMVRKAEAGAKSTITVVLTLVGDFSGRALEKEVAQLLPTKLRAGSVLSSYRITDTNATSSLVVARGGTRAARYCVVDPHSQSVRFEDGFATMKLAQQEATRRAGTSRGSESFGVVMVTAGEKGPLVLVKRVVKKTVVTCEVRVTTGQMAAGEEDGWLFFGWART